MAEREPELERRARLGIAAVIPPRASPRVLVYNALFTVVVATLFPRLHHRLNWVARANVRGIATYLFLEAGSRMFGDAIVRWSARFDLRRAELERRLRRELGRPPWPEELERAWAKEHGYENESTS
jgi:hypothetical protein